MYNLTLHKDINGRFLEVPKNQLIDLNISSFISGNSFENEYFIFLDFNTDMIVYMSVVVGKEEVGNIKVCQVNNVFNSCRNYKRYKPDNDFSFAKQNTFIQSKKRDTRTLENLIFNKVEVLT